MLQLNIAVHDAKTKLEIRDPVLYVKTTDSKLDMSSGEAKITIQQPDAIVEIDQSAFYKACGLKSIRDQDLENTQKAYNNVLKTIGKTVRDGDSVANHDATIPQLAKSKMISQPPEIELESIPEPTIRITPQAAHIQVQKGNLDIHFQQGTVGGEFQQGSVNLQMLQYPSVSVSVSGSKLDVSA
jgi:hypothetical protein